VPPQSYRYVTGACAALLSDERIQAPDRHERSHWARGRQPVQASLAELVRRSGEHGIGLFVDGANYDDVARDKDETRRLVTLSKLTKFQQLRGIPLPAESDQVARF